MLPTSPSEKGDFTVTFFIGVDQRVEYSFNKLCGEG